ncbi:MAG TPA: tetratricopeptide repeat protein [Vicinamibacterales bacterium]|nr:tetratricopeptide repeat protein [Vicinamibacterales bacterium]
MVGSSVGPYQILDKLGVGGMGEVFLGHDPRLQRRVALKCLAAPPGAVGDRILREARAAARLNHPNIAGVYDVIEHDDRTFIVMEYVEGESLAARLRRGLPPVDEVRAIGRQLASALAAAHAQGVIHRDLKPANVMIARDGTIKVLDFGVAKLSAPAAGTEDATGHVAPESTLQGNPGTPVYMSPEQLFDRPIDGRSDLYSAGVILFEMVTGRRPYAATGAVSLALAMSKSPAPAPRSVTPSTPADLDAVIARALEREPDHRFQSAREMEAALTTTSERNTAIASLTRSPHFARWVTTGVLAVLAVVLMIVERGYLTGPASAPPHIVLATLPVEASGTDSRSTYLGVGMMSVLADNFGSLPGFTIVRAPSSSLDRSQAAMGPLYRELGATHMIALSLSSVEPKTRVVARLFSSTSDQPVWTETIDGTPLEAQSRLLMGLRSAFEKSASRSFTSAERDRLQKLPTTNSAALLQYCEAKHVLNGTPRDETRAIALLEQATAADPRFVSAWAALGDAWWNRYQFEKDPSFVAHATDAVNQAIAIDPTSPQVYDALGFMQMRTGRLNEAESSFRRALQLQPALDDAERNLADVLSQMGRVDEAVAYGKHAIRTSQNWRNFYLLGFVYYRAGRYQEAADAFRAATDVAPNNASSYTMLGTAEYVLGDMQQAVGNYQHAVRLGPTATAHANLGMAYYESNRLDDALQSYQRSIDLDPRVPLNHRNIADVYSALGRSEDARREYRAAIAIANEFVKVNPRDARSIALIALCEARLGEAASAENHAAEAVAVDSTNREAWQRSAEVHAILKQSEQAFHDLEKAVALGFDPKMARREQEFASLKASPRFEQILTKAPGNAGQTRGERR